MFTFVQKKSLLLLLKIMLSALLVCGGSMFASAKQQIITKIEDYEFKDNTFIVQTVDQKFYATLSQQDEDGIARFLFQLSSLQHFRRKVFIQYENDKLLSIQELTCKALEFSKEDDDLIYMTYGIAPGVKRIDKHNDALYNKYLELAALIKQNSLHKNKKFVEFAATNEGVIEYISGLCSSPDY